MTTKIKIVQTAIKEHETITNDILNSLNHTKIININTLPVVNIGGITTMITVITYET